MQTHLYLDRIKYRGSIRVDNDTLFKLHEHHVMNVPFENLDIHYERLFNLELDNIFNKVIANKRGGFCYELNYLFCDLLKQLGFNSRIISAGIYADAGIPGPPFDHMAIYVKTDRDFLLDVGFGDLFLTPLEIKEGTQTDGRCRFKIEALYMSTYGTLFLKKYIFNLDVTSIDDFKEACHDKQVNPESYFVKNTICTKPTPDGRITIFNKKFVETTAKGRIDSTILKEEDLGEVLKLRFDIIIK